MQEALQRASAGRTALVIAHRLATVRNADKVVVLDEGRVLDTGRHHELYQRCELYRRLCDLQVSVTICWTRSTACGRQGFAAHTRASHRCPAQPMRWCTATGTRPIAAPRTQRVAPGAYGLPLDPVAGQPSSSRG